MTIVRMPGAARIGTVHCNVSLDNSKLIENVIITGFQSASPLTGAAECQLLLKTSVFGQTISMDMDAIYSIPNVSIVRYIAKDLNYQLAGAYIKTAFINCSVEEAVSSFTIENIGVSYY